MTDYTNLKEVLEFDISPDPRPKQKKKSNTEAGQPNTDSKHVSSDEPDADFEEKLLRALEKGEVLNQKQINFIDRQLVSDPEFVKKYEDAYRVLLNQKRLVVRRERAKAIEKHISETNPRLFEVIKQRKKKAIKSQSDEESPRKSEKAIKIKVLRVIQKERVTAGDWKAVYKDVQTLENNQKSGLTRKAAATRKSGKSQSPVYITIKVKKAGYIQSGELTLKKQDKLNSISGTLRLASHARAIALLLSNGTRIDLVSDEDGKIKFDDIELDGTINIDHVQIIVLE